MRNRLTDLGRLAASGVADAREKVTGSASAASAKERVGLSLENISLPSVPPEEAWSLSLASLIASNRDIPAVALKLLGMLDRFGSVRVSADEVGFDADDVKWSQVTLLRTASVFDVLTDVAIQREVERLRMLLPPVPGRKWLIRRALQWFQVLLRRATGLDGDSTASTEIVAEILYKGRLGGQKELRVGVVSAAILAALPQVNASIAETARMQGVQVGAPAGRAVQANTLYRRKQVEETAAKLSELDDFEDQV
jgi:hypothetical protein